MVGWPKSRLAEEHVVHVLLAKRDPCSTLCDRMLEEVRPVSRVDLEGIVRVQISEIEDRLHCGTMYHMRVVASMLADAAVVQGGKLYIHGGGWDTIRAHTFPTTHPSLALALLFQIEYSEAPGELPVSIRLVDEDRKEEERVRVEGTVSVGHAPGSVKGAPSFVPFVLTIPGLSFEHPGSFSFKVTTDENWLASLPLHVHAASPARQT